MRDVTIVALRPESHPAREAARKPVERRMAAISATQRDVVAANLDLESIMSLVVERTQELTQADGAALLLLDGGYVGVRAASGSAVSQLRLRVPLTASVLGEWVDDGDPIRCSDTLADDRFTRTLDRRIVERFDARSLVAVPLHSDRRTVGLLQVTATRADAFTEGDVECVELLAVVLAAALSQAADFGAKREQVDALAQFQAMYDGAPIGILFVAPTGTILKCNPAVTEILGFEPEELAGEQALELVVRADREVVAKRIKSLIADERDNERVEVRHRNRDDAPVWTTLSLSLVRDSDGEPSFTIAMLEDISARKAAEEELRRHAELSEYQALHDALTGLPNRVLFHDRIAAGAPDGASAKAAASPSCSSTSTASRRSTTRSVTPPATTS